MNAIVVTTTSDKPDELETIARQLVTAKLAACCQIIGPHTSIYRWQGNVETATEWMCLIKTRSELYAAVESTIRELHSYEVPEIIATEISLGCESYLKWLFDETQAQPEDI
jgi:periplasmic divalent cation tolerance protein